MGIAGMILGILAMIFVWIPLVGIIAIPLVAVGLPLSLAGLIIARRHDDGAGMAIAGLVTNVLAAAIIMVWVIFVGSWLAYLLR